MAGKVTVGLASHWPCVTDRVVCPPTGSMAWEREMEMSTPPTLHWITTAFLAYILRAVITEQHCRNNSLMLGHVCLMHCLMSVWQLNRFRGSADKCND